MSRPDGQGIDLTDLVKNPSRVTELDRNCLSALLTQLSAIQASMAAHLVAAVQNEASEAQDTLLDVGEAAARLGVSADWIYRRTSKLPFVVRVGRRVRCSSNGINKFVRNRMGAK